MSRSGKRLNSIREQIEPGKAYAIDEALEILKDASKVKFTESVDVAIRLGVDSRKSDQNVRGSTVLPNGTGKKVRVAVFAQGENAGEGRSSRRRMLSAWMTCMIRSRKAIWAILMS